jgi:polar amino acid transport system permease protein
LVFGFVGLGYFAVCFPLIVVARRLERRMNAAHAEVQL